MNFYAITVNGDLSTVAHLTEADGKSLRDWAAEQNEQGLTRVVVTELHTLHTDLTRTIMAVESDIETWRL